LWFYQVRSQVGRAFDRLCEMDGARWVHDSDALGAIRRRDVMTILTHHAASRQAAVAPYGMKCGAAGFLSLSDRSPILALMDYRDRIVIDPEIRFGKPSVRGTRITVGDVLSYLASGMSEQQILADFPQLTRDDIRACLAFAAERERRIVSIPAS
jgi:uncharacterized protein (DUF433 family)